MTSDQRVAALVDFGLTSRQARFLVTVALHSGYCLRRQYAKFAGVEYGALVRDFLDHLVARRWATRHSYRADRGFVYHLQSKAVYRALGQDDNRNRRAVSPALIARKLMVLDAVLAMPDVEWIATEDDKVRLLTEQFGIRKAHLPQRVFEGPRDSRSADAAVAASGTSQAACRYVSALQSRTTRFFLQKWPIASAADGSVRFVALVLDTSGRAFDGFLFDHARLVANLPSWEIILVSHTGFRGLTACRATFERYQQGCRTRALLPPAELRRYFATRLALETDELSSVSIDDLAHYRRHRVEWQTPAIETTYARWCALGDQIWKSHPESLGSLRILELPFTYRQFGDLPGEC